MRSFIGLTFLLLFAVYWQMSGGANFVPQERPATAAAAETVTRAEPVPLVAEAPQRIPEAIAIEPADIAAAVASALPEGAATEEIPVLPEEGPVFESLVAPVAAPGVRDADPPSAAAPAELMYVAGSVVNMRDGPGTAYPVIARLPAGTITEVIERARGWVRVRVQGEGTSGWMAADFLRPLSG